MTTYTCAPFARVKDGDEMPDHYRGIENARDAALVFAGRMARKQYGKRGLVHHVRADGWHETGKYIHWECFIGKPTRDGGVTGHNEHITVYVHKEVR